MVFNVLKQFTTLKEIVAELNRIALSRKGDKEFETWYINRVPVAFEAMIVGGWVKATLDPSQPVMPVRSNTGVMHWHVDTKEVLKGLSESP